MAGFNELQRLSGQSIQSTLTRLENLVQTGVQSQPLNSPLGADNAVVTGGGPSYMQAVQALAEMTLLMGSGVGELGHLQSLNGGGETRKADDDDSGPIFQSNYNRQNNGGGFFNPINYRPANVHQRNGNGSQDNSGYGRGSRTGAGNVSADGIDRMLELILAQSLGRNSSVAQPRFRQDAVTLDGTTPQSEANGFKELTGALVMLLADEINSAGQNGAQPTPQLRHLFAELAKVQSNGQSLTQPQMQALMDEMAVLQLIESTRQKSADSGNNQMINTIMQLMQNLLGAQSGNLVNPAQIKQLLGALMNNLTQNEGGDSSQAAQLMQQMLPEMLAMLDAESNVPGAIAPVSNNNNTPKPNNNNSAPIQPFSASISSDGISTGNVQGSPSSMKFQVQPGSNGGVSILDASSEKDLAGGIQIGASMSKDGSGNEKIKVGTFSWNGGQDAVAMNATGEAAVTSDGGQTWSPLPQQGVSTYNPGNGGPNISYNPDTKTLSFSASGNNNNSVTGTMRAGSDGVNFVNIEGTGNITAGGQLPGAMS